jgi:hypothetical protein
MLNKKEIEENIYKIVNESRQEDIYSDLLFLVLEIAAKGYTQIELYNMFIEISMNLKKNYNFQVVKVVYGIMDIIWYGKNDDCVKLFDHSLTNEDLELSKSSENMFIIRKDYDKQRSRVFIESKEKMLLYLNE